MDDNITGMRVAVEVTVDLPSERFWDLVTDVTRIGGWSPECRYAGWLGSASWPPRPGHRFEAHNEFRNGMVNDVVCMVTEADRPGTFAWVVLDDAADPDRPAVSWRYDLLPADRADRTLIRHSFVHGPGESNLRKLIRANPDRGDGILVIRGDQLRENMTGTIEAIVRSATVTRPE